MSEGRSTVINSGSLHRAASRQKLLDLKLAAAEHNRRQDLTPPVRIVLITELTLWLSHTVEHNHNDLLPKSAILHTVTASADCHRST